MKGWFESKRRRVVMYPLPQEYQRSITSPVAQCVALKLELEDAKASGDLHKGRVKALVADKDSFILDDAHGLGSGLEAAAPTGVAADV